MKTKTLGTILGAAAMLALPVFTANLAPVNAALGFDIVDDGAAYARNRTTTRNKQVNRNSTRQNARGGDANGGAGGAGGAGGDATSTGGDATATSGVGAATATGGVGGAATGGAGGAGGVGGVGGTGGDGGTNFNGTLQVNDND